MGWVKSREWPTITATLFLDLKRRIWYNSCMKTKVIITSAISALILGVATTFAVASSNVEEKPVAQSSVQQSVQPTPEEKAVEPTVQEVTTPAVQETAPVQEAPAVSAPKYFEKDKLFSYTLTKLISALSGTALNTKAAPITGAIFSNYDAHKELFTLEAIDNSIDKCVAYYSALSPQEVQLALAKNDCGF